jgi:type I restriction enzyme S subunit
MTAIAVPPLAEQQEIVRRVEELCALADQIEARYAKAKQYVDSLKQSILAKAFRGELVPQDPNDEPATVLIERIREARGTKTMDRPKPRATKSGIAHQNPVL